MILQAYCLILQIALYPDQGIQVPAYTIAKLQNEAGRMTDTHSQLDAPLCHRLAELTLAHAADDGIQDTCIPGLQIFRSDHPSSFNCAVYEPALCVIVQGSKMVQLGDKDIAYGPLSYMVSAVDLPVVGSIEHASPEKPYLAVKLLIDPQEVAEMVLELGNTLPPLSQQRDCAAACCGMSVAPVDVGILDAMTRLMSLLHSPSDCLILAPLVRREIIYRALVGEMGWRIRDFVANDSQAHRRSTDTRLRRSCMRL